MPHRRWAVKAEVRTLTAHRRRGLATHARPTAEPADSRRGGRDPEC
jgi:hypothetical protein